jgi:hypothetical protein
VGCASSVIGVILFGVVLPCAGFNYSLSHDGLEMGGLLFWPFAMAVGAVLGAVVAPLCSLGVYWLVWRLAGRR